MDLLRSQPFKDGTDQEKIIGEVLQSLGVRYEEQAPFGNKLADFYIAEINTVVEADGVYGHSAKADAKRDAELKELGIDEIWHVKAKTRKDIQEQIEAFFAGLWEETYGNQKDNREPSVGEG